MDSKQETPDKKYNEKREVFREPVYITVDYVTAGRIRNEFITDLSDQGVFIETSDNLDVGDYIVLTYFNPLTREDVKIGGVVVRKTDNGIGVKLNLRSKYDRDKAFSKSEQGDDFSDKIWGPWTTLSLSVGIALVWYFAQILIIRIWMLINISQEIKTSTQKIADAAGNSGLVFFLATCIASGVSIFMIVNLIRIRQGYSVTKYLGLYRISFKTFLSAGAMTLGFILFSTFMNIIFNQYYNNEIISESIITANSPLLIFLTLVIAVPVSEEFFFRGFLMEGFRHTWIGNTGAVILTSLAWAMIHLHYDAFGQGMLFILGLLLGIMRIRTGSIWSSVAMHGINNLVATVIIILYVSTH